MERTLSGHMTCHTFDDGVLEALRQVVALLLVLRVGELVFGLGQFPLQTLQTPLLLLRLPLRLLLQPLRHPDTPQRNVNTVWADARPRPQEVRLLLFLVVDVSEAAPAQVSARLAVGRLLDLSAESSQHGAEP